MKKSLLVLTLAIVVLGLVLSQAAFADSLTIGDTHELGYVQYGIPSGDADRTNYVNHLLGMSLGTTDSSLGQTFTRSNNNFGSLPTAVWALNGTSTSINIGSGSYSYLFAKYDGPNYGSEVWYIGNLSGTITIPATGGTAQHQYGLSGWTLFGPGTSTPEPASLALLSAGLIGLGGMFKRRM